MTHFTRQFFWVLALLPAACDRPPAVTAQPAATAPATAPATARAAQSRVARIDRALAGASRYLVARQSRDGAWRSDVYGPLRDGPTLTPYVMTCLYLIQRGEDRERAALSNGSAYLRGLIDAASAEPREPLGDAVYTAAPASWVAVLGGRTEENLRLQQAWVRYLRGRQLNASLGWDTNDPAFGGWGYAVPVPHKPGPGDFTPPLLGSNLSATVYALGALRCANVPMDDPAYGEILTFVKRCQNFADDAGQADPAFDDGGFYFTPGDPAMNKAGVAGTDRLGRTRYHAYGSMTADGLRALLHAGLPPDHPRVIAARRWLERHFTPDANPGTFAPGREVLRNATYYYYCWSAAHALMHLEVKEIETTSGRVNWAEALADVLIARQRPDGSWSNAFTDTKEDDPLVATPAAAAALAVCRRVIAGGGPTHRL